MLKQAYLLSVAGLCIGIAGCSNVLTSPAPQTPPTPTPVIPASAFAVWPQVSGRVGSDGAQSDQDIADMAADGLSMVIGGFKANRLLKANRLG